ncbi:ParB/RepB/Spo0J family partition protein [Streptomyces sp. NPDC006393]|uniref:ParB/RepB/Spo0J family partition protein n=1 Tax=Streptomyces sp. NPDC006393 TaxID=3156763 RepID=UPI0033F12A5B
MSSKASTLGAGRFGSKTTAPVSARRQAVAAATGVPTDGVAPPTRLPVDRISLNPDNPRSQLGDLTELTGSLREHGQKQAITVMNRDAYVKANPARDNELEPSTTHVVIDGSSRLAAAREAGLTHIKVWVDDDQGADSEALLESALVANIHRQDLAELDEARALERLMAIYGSQSALAKRLHKSQGWVSQRLALLNLTPELQAKIGEESIKLLRAVGNKPPEEQATALEALKRQQAEKEAARGQAGKHASKRQPETLTNRAGHYPVIEPASGTGEPSTHYPVMEPASGTGEPSTREAGSTAVHPSPTAGLPDRIPEPRDVHTDAVEQPLKRFPYEDGPLAAQHLIRKMPAAAFDAMLELLLEHRTKRADKTR